ncbi:hypothetical protein Sp245p_29465 (plasmid) [Azospirillum baldaniorum]|uniref:Uncharacterized 17.8 kDa protein in nodG 5'region (Modular protein) n=2 Tax=Azospirillum baldaniorum TaxID=1064539 RepID=A0A9P1JYC7_9PROT|nr:hypothetical protein Sp245p_29465 [Azospirillum baldaniorum]TWA81775.1 hypothetical protein FBZ85_102149 [Azospirillum brasilense]CCD02125.1 uncharacterized 17.8 kDa protein in nodG 5'region (modular protein) [Azospirillum baldaniorum]
MVGRLRHGKSGLMPRRGHGIALALQFFAQGGRTISLRVPAATPSPDNGAGLRTIPVRVSIQPDGDVLVALPRAAVENGGFDAASAARLTAQLRRLVGRVTSANPLWGIDALQALGEAVTAVAGLCSGAVLLWNGFERMSAGQWAHSGATLVLLAAPAALAKLRPWFLGAVAPKLFPLALKAGERIVRI